MNATPICTCLLVMAWEEPCPLHGALAGTVAAADATPPDLSIEDVLANLRVFSPAFPDPFVGSLAMHPTTYDAFIAQIEAAETLPSFLVELVIDAALPPGVVVPLDRDGKPTMKPRAARAAEVPS